MRLDKYLKVSRIIKRRTVANEACDAGRVEVNGKVARASYDVKIGDNCTIKCGVQIWDGITIEDNVMIGANTTFTNDKYPRSKNFDWKCLRTYICKGVSIGAGSTILPGLIIGENAMIGAGSVVIKDIPSNVVAVGNPCKVIKK